MTGLRELCRVTFAVEAIHEVGEGPLGRRIVGVARDGHWTGDRLNGSQLGPGGDWLVLDSQGRGTVDARSLLATTDGALVYVSYAGRLDWRTGRLRCSFLFETESAEYAWLNTTQGVGLGRIGRDQVSYQVWELTDD